MTEYKAATSDSGTLRKEDELGACPCCSALGWRPPGFGKVSGFESAGDRKGVSPNPCALRPGATQCGPARPRGTRGRAAGEPRAGVVDSRHVRHRQDPGSGKTQAPARPSPGTLARLGCPGPIRDTTARWLRAPRAARLRENLAVSRRTAIRRPRPDPHRHSSGPARQPGLASLRPSSTGRRP